MRTTLRARQNNAKEFCNTTLIEELCNGTTEFHFHCGTNNYGTPTTLDYADCRESIKLNNNSSAIDIQTVLDYLFAWGYEFTTELTLCYVWGCGQLFFYKVTIIEE